MNSSLKIPTYYYTITGDAVLGDNRNDKLFTTNADNRFPINEPQEILLQSKGWVQPTSNQISPLYENVAPGLIPAKFSLGRSTPNPANA